MNLQMELMDCGCNFHKCYRHNIGIFCHNQQRQLTFLWRGFTVCYFDILYHIYFPITYFFLKNFDKLPSKKFLVKKIRKFSYRKNCPHLKWRSVGKKCCVTLNERNIFCARQQLYPIILRKGLIKWPEFATTNKAEKRNYLNLVREKWWWKPTLEWWRY